MKKFVLCCAVATFLGAPAFAAPAGSEAAYDSILKGQWTEAEATLRQGLAQNPNDAARLLNLAFVLQNTNRQPEAAAVYQQVLKLEQNPIVSVEDAATMSRPARAKLLAKKGMASLESK